MPYESQFQEKQSAGQPPVPTTTRFGFSNARFRQGRARFPQRIGATAGGADVYAVLAVCGFLLLAVGLVFGQTINHEFVNFDDTIYVYDNPHVTHGLTAAGIVWAFTTMQASNWHPLDLALPHAGLPVLRAARRRHHLTNVLLHAATAILLFLVLRRMTGDLWPSAFVAAVFAIHPLRVESVAWVAERKDVLSGLFFMLTLWAYVGYVRRPFSLVRYLAVMALFALGLMAKPMLVTLPFVLLLLDYWPLGRMDGRAKLPLSLSSGSAGASPSRFSCWGGSYTATPEATVQLSPQQSATPRPVVAVRDATTGRGFTSNAWHLLVEKIPLFVLAAASCVATTLAQRRAIMRGWTRCRFPCGFPTPWFPTWPIWASFSIRWGWPCSIPTRVLACRFGNQSPPSWRCRPFPSSCWHGDGVALSRWSAGSGIWGCWCR